MSLSVDSSAPEIMRDVRRLLVLGNIGVAPSMRQSRHMISGQHEKVAQAHVYDTAYLFDLNHPAYIGNEANLSLVRFARELQVGVGLFLPHPVSSFICRVRNSDGMWHLFVACMEENPEAIFVVSYYLNQRAKNWSWLGVSAIRRKSPTAFLSDSDVRIDASVLVADPAIGRPSDSLIAIPLAEAMLLLQKSDTIIREPADWWMGETPPAKPKAFERPNPSVTVVRVNTPRLIISPPQDAATTPAPFTPRHVRSHIRTYANGRRTVVRSHVSPRDSVLGGPAIRVVRTSGPLEGGIT